MASHIFDTGVASHPKISIDNIDLKNGAIDFKWLGAVHSGDCREPFEISLADHGALTVNQVVQMFADAMIAKLPGAPGGQ